MWVFSVTDTYTYLYEREDGHVLEGSAWQRSRMPHSGLVPRWERCYYVPKAAGVVTTSGTLADMLSMLATPKGVPYIFGKDPFNMEDYAAFVNEVLALKTV